jgi:hypothetical protein
MYQVFESKPASGFNINSPAIETIAGASMLQVSTYISELDGLARLG